MDGRASTGGLLVALGLTLAAILCAPAASPARTAHDPCPGAGRFDRLVCQDVTEISRHTTIQVPLDRICRDDERMAGMGFLLDTTAAGVLHSREANWDFWSNNGEWVTWDGFGNFDLKRDRDIWVPRGYSPYLHNWWVGPWQVRLYHRCAGRYDPLSHRAGPGDPSRDADRGPAGDYHFAGQGPDTERGGAGVDAIRGGRGDDELRGGEGGDQLLSGPGDDESHGGTGSDELFDDHGLDELDGGPGNDRFSAMDDDSDTIRCGGGEDVAVADDADRVRGCEHVFTSAADAPAEPPRN